MSDRFHTLHARGISVTLDLAAGHIRSLEIANGAEKIRPLHTAPWVDDTSIYEDEDIPLNLRCLSGDFFCAPFAASDVEEAPLHGWPANSPWRLIGKETRADGATARYELGKRILGARLVKEFMLRDGHPFLYERHVFVGGAGALPVANHAMTNFPAGGRLFFSPKSYGETLSTPIEPDPSRGRYHLKHPTHFTDLTQVETASGGIADITHYPFAERHEDFAMLVEAPGHTLGWAAALRPSQGDMFVSLKNPRTYPVTFLWFSNGGRDYAPWNSRHMGVLGIEEGRSFSAYGHKASIAANQLNASGIPTALDLNPSGEADVRNVIGGLPLDGWRDIAGIEAQAGRLIIANSCGQTRDIPYDDAFLRA